MFSRKLEELMSNNIEREFVVEACARAGHETNRAFAIVLGDDSHRSWDDSPEYQRRICRQGVRGILESDHNAEASHAAWVQAMLADGWHLGDKKNVEKKTHPCLRPFNELPFEVQAKDDLFVQVVKAVAASIWRIPQS